MGFETCVTWGVILRRGVLSGRVRSKSGQVRILGCSATHSLHMLFCSSA